MMGSLAFICTTLYLAIPAFKGSLTHTMDRYNITGLRKPAVHLQIKQSLVQVAFL